MAVAASTSVVVSLSHFSFPFNTFEERHSNFAELNIIMKYWSSSILVIIHQILAELWPVFELVFIVRFSSVTFAGMH